MFGYNACDAAETTRSGDGVSTIRSCDGPISVSAGKWLVLTWEAHDFSFRVLRERIQLRPEVVALCFYQFLEVESPSDRDFLGALLVLRRVHGSLGVHLVEDRGGRAIELPDVKRFQARMKTLLTELYP